MKCNKIPRMAAPNQDRNNIGHGFSRRIQVYGSGFCTGSFVMWATSWARFCTHLARKLSAIQKGRLCKPRWCIEMRWLRGSDLNRRPPGYEPDELPGCSTPRIDITRGDALLQLQLCSTAGRLQKSDYHELYGVFSNGDTWSDDECTSEIPPLELSSGLSNTSEVTVVQSFLPVTGSFGMARR
jgi:hypothetical protein